MKTVQWGAIFLMVGLILLGVSNALRGDWLNLLGNAGTAWLLVLCAHVMREIAETKAMIDGNERVQNEILRRLTDR